MKELENQSLRAEDILLGALGFGDTAKITFIHRTSHGYAGAGKWDDGERFTFESDTPPTEIENWALDILIPLLSPSDR